MQSSVNVAVPVTVERDYIRAGCSWWVGFTAPMGQQLGGWCVVDDFGNLVAAQ
ncbi:hypothetical protein [Variovorax sp. 3P27G3]|uniref:hypothetical protein n=1 Tax=Variovorax sp. 3P27G3 TaxID=2502214 RepID=UPI0014853698|nr:hypothetical protein [Variovorax sp. 3P27G3]